MAKQTSLPKFESAPIYDVPVPDVLSYHVIVRPKPAQTKSAGGLIMAKTTKRAELAVRTVGQLMAVGALAWKARTPDLDFSMDPVASTVKVGDWVVFRQHAGQKLRLRRRHDDAVPVEDDDEYLLWMADTDILGRFTDQAQAERFYDWV